MVESKSGQIVFMEKLSTTEAGRAEQSKDMVPASSRDQRLLGHTKQPSKQETSRPGKEGQAKAWTESSYQLQVLTTSPLWLFSQVSEAQR